MNNITNENKSNLNLPSNVHNGHRRRLKEKFLRSGFDNFAEHEILEFLLFYSIPLADTNPLAHNLINKYGGFHNVFDTSYDSLITNTGVGSHTAILLKLIPAIMNIYNKEKAMPVEGLKDNLIAMQFVRKLFEGLDHEEFYIICLSPKCAIISTKKISTGNFCKVEVPIREVTDYIFKNSCDRIIIAHNHPHGKGVPSDEDIMLTHKLFNSCVLNDIDILDHIIYSPNGMYSFAGSGVMSDIKNDVLSILRYDKQSALYKRFSTNYDSYVVISTNNN